MSDWKSPAGETMNRPKVFYRVERCEDPAMKPGEFRLVTAAVMMCSLCGTVIAGMGGGGTFLCEPCGKVVESGRAVGAIKWDHGTETP